MIEVGQHDVPQLEGVERIAVPDAPIGVARSQQGRDAPAVECEQLGCPVIVQVPGHDPCPVALCEHARVVAGGRPAERRRYPVGRERQQVEPVVGVQVCRAQRSNLERVGKQSFGQRFKGHGERARRGSRHARRGTRRPHAAQFAELQFEVVGGANAAVGPLAMPAQQHQSAGLLRLIFGPGQDLAQPVGRRQRPAAALLVFVVAVVDDDAIDGRGVVSPAQLVVGLGEVQTGGEILGCELHRPLEARGGVIEPSLAHSEHTACIRERGHVAILTRGVVEPCVRSG